MNVLLQMIDKKLMKNNRFTFFMSNDADKGKSGIWFDDVPQSLYQVILSSRLLSCIKLFVCRVNLKSTRLFPRTTGASSYWTSRCTHTTPARRPSSTLVTMASLSWLAWKLRGGQVDGKSTGVCPNGCNAAIDSGTSLLTAPTTMVSHVELFACFRCVQLHSQLCIMLN